MMEFIIFLGEVITGPEFYSKVNEIIPISSFNVMEVF